MKCRHPILTAFLLCVACGATPARTETAISATAEPRESAQTPPSCEQSTHCGACVAIPGCLWSANECNAQYCLEDASCYGGEGNGVCQAPATSETGHARRVAPRFEFVSLEVPSAFRNLETLAANTPLGAGAQSIAEQEGVRVSVRVQNGAATGARLIEEALARQNCTAQREESSVSARDGEVVEPHGESESEEEAPMQMAPYKVTQWRAECGTAAVTIRHAEYNSYACRVGHGVSIAVEGDAASAQRVFESIIVDESQSDAGC